MSERFIESEEENLNSTESSAESSEKIESLEAEANEVRIESEVLAKELESTQVDIENWGHQELSRLAEKTRDIENSWYDVKERALALGIGTVLASDLAVIATGLSGYAPSGWTETTGAMIVGAALAVNIIGYQINGIIHRFKERKNRDEKDEVLDKMFPKDFGQNN